MTAEELFPDTSASCTTKMRSLFCLVSPSEASHPFLCPFLFSMSAAEVLNPRALILCRRLRAEANGNNKAEMQVNESLEYTT
jgi:hypothetical protein